MQPVTSGGARREAAFVGIGAAVVYLVTMTGGHREAEDALAYAVGIRGGAAEDVLDANHLLWGALGWLVHNSAHAVGIGDGPLPALQAMNAVVGGAGVAVMWWFLRSLGWERRGAAAACGLIALSFGYWHYSGEAEVYVLSAALLIVCLVAAHRAATEPSVAAFAVLGLANGLAVLAHNTNALFVVVAAAALAEGWRRLPRGAPARSLARPAAVYAVAVLAVTLPAYAGAAAAVGVRDPGEFVDWARGHAGDDSWGKLESASVPNAVVGGGRTVIGADFMFALGDFDTLGERVRGQRFLMRDYPEGPAVALLVLSLAVAAIILAGLVAGLRDGARGPSPESTLTRLCLAWLVPYALFFLWWEPLNSEFWIVVWIPVAVLAGRGLARSRRARWAVPVVLAGLGAVNLAGSVGPQLDEGNDYWRARLAWYEDNARPNDLILSNGYVMAGYLRYFSQARVVDARAVAKPQRDPRALALEVRRIMAASDPDRILVSSEAFDPVADRYSTCRGTKACEHAAALRRFFKPHATVVARTELETVWGLPLVPPAAGTRSPPSGY